MAVDRATLAPADFRAMNPTLATTHPGDDPRHTFLKPQKVIARCRCRGRRYAARSPVRRGGILALTWLLSARTLACCWTTASLLRRWTTAPRAPGATPWAMPPTCGAPPRSEERRVGKEHKSPRAPN